MPPLITRLLIAAGKRAALSSALLGALCIVAELCFLLPDLLVTRDTLPLYKAHIDLCRVILQVSLFATFALGTLSVIVMRTHRRGLLGIVFGIVAMAMGGPQAQALDVGGMRSWSAGLDYFVLELLVLGMIFMPVEALFWLRRQKVLRHGWQIDLKHFFVSHAGVQLLSFAALIPAQMLFSWAVQPDFQRVIAAQPLWLQFIEMIALVDLATYWIHRAFHQIPWLWRFHAIHHSSTEMDWLAGSRIHPVDALLTRAVAFIPVFVLGFAPAALYSYLVFVSFHAVFIHANVRWRFPVLRWMLSTPQFHHWHHTCDAEGLDKNFAQFLPLWDRLFATVHLPHGWPRRYGIDHFQAPQSYLEQLASPFRSRKASPTRHPD